MDVEVSGVVGEEFLTQGAQGNLRLGPLGAAIVSELHGRYTMQNYQGRVFYVANTAAQALSLTGTTTYTGLCLVNPASSNVLIAILEITWAVSVAPLGISGAILGFNNAVPSTLTTQVNTFPSRIPTGVNNAKPNVSAATAYSAVTLAANPNFGRGLFGVLATGSTGTLASGKDDVGGVIILNPGTCCVIVAVTTALSGVFSYSWEELPTNVFT